LMVDAAGGWDTFLERYAVVVVADHSQTTVERGVDATEPFEGLELFRSSRHSDPAQCDLAIAASNRVAMAYLLPAGRLTASEVGHRFARHPSSDVVMWSEGAWFAVRREGGELRFRRGAAEEDARGNRWDVVGDRDLLDPALYPNALERIEGILTCPAAGDVVVSAVLGDEFADAGGVHHAGGGSHGSLRAEDSLVPLIAAGFESGTGLGAQPSITDLTPLARRLLAPAGTIAAGAH
jgi:hypothetical protein